ncbi:MAG: HigA family addiction module antidote protein [Thiobacillus sp.]|nr:HigA family addiction module antidote protein [Thiobacillus sp.]
MTVALLPASFAAGLVGAAHSQGAHARPFFRPPPGLSSRRPPHPGHMLQSHFLAPSGMTQGELARLLGVSRRRVNELLNGRRGVSPDTALRLASHFNTDPTLWTAWQSAFDLHQAWRTLRRASLS